MEINYCCRQRILIIKTDQHHEQLNEKLNSELTFIFFYLTFKKIKVYQDKGINLLQHFFTVIQHWIQFEKFTKLTTKIIQQVEMGTTQLPFVQNVTLMTSLQNGSGNGTEEEPAFYGFYQVGFYMFFIILLQLLFPLSYRKMLFSHLL